VFISLANFHTFTSLLLSLLLLLLILRYPYFCIRIIFTCFRAPKSERQLLKLEVHDVVPLEEEHYHLLNPAWSLLMKVFTFT
jgi:hypothetical protein